ncbi:MAG TPA: type II secretion system F family protein [Nocardioides sp.]|nr:type II secretion system F family protein [Nocardioides sp.]
MRRAAVVLTGTLGVLLSVLLGAPSYAAGQATIAHVQTSGGNLQVLVDVPPGTNVDLSGVSATLDGAALDATATSARTGSTVERTAVLAMDTSDSMASQGRFTAAKQAALTYLQTVPADVKVGVVTFDSHVSVALAPTTDRDQARFVVNGLQLSHGTLLYDGLQTAVQTAGTTGQRSVLLLSDGADTGSSATLAQVAGSVRSTKTLLDAVSLGQQGSDLTALRNIATAGNGVLIQSTGSALSGAFRREADVLASQVLVTAPVPSDFTHTQATVRVTLPSNEGQLVATALAPIEVSQGPAATPTLSNPNASTGLNTPGWLLYAGIGVLALGLVGGAVLLVPGKPAPLTIADRVSQYTARTSGPAVVSQKPATEPVLDQAKAAAASILERNQNLDQRLALRLSAAGSSFKPSEWLLLHVGVVIGAALLGALVGVGNIWIALVFAVVGGIVPPLYLRWRARRRRRAFDDALPEVLQLLAGALSAGLSLPQAVDTVVREGPDPIAGEFKRVLVESRIGVGIEDAFDGVAERFDSKDFAWVVMAIRIQRQVGGNLAELLKTVAGTMRERAYLRRQVNALAAEGKLSAVILSVLPPGVAGFVLLTNPSYMQPMFTTTLGWILLIGAVVWLSIGVFWMGRLVKVEI